MKNDILEQVIEDWLVSQEGWFVKHNIKFRPDNSPDNKHKNYDSKKDSVHSDIDILAFSRKKEVKVVTCKSWQNGFYIKEWIDIFNSDSEDDETPKYKKNYWKHFREIISDKWIEAFINKIENETGVRNFEYIIAVTKLYGEPSSKNEIEKNKTIMDKFKKHKSKIEIKFITLEEILNDFKDRIKIKKTPSLESTDVGRFLQLINAAELKIENNKSKL